MTLTRVVAITGCDSGLGWAMAARSARQGLVTVAGMYQGTNTPAARALKAISVIPYPLDVTDKESIFGFKDYVMRLIKEHPDYTLHAVVNNAGVMTIGDYEWQTPRMIENTVAVNLLGAMNMVCAFLPELRRSALVNSSALKPRIINVASHCGLQPLPGFAAYSASKAGLLALTRALRYELRPYSLTAVAFIPGGFVGSSNIISKQTADGHDMLAYLNEEQVNFYGKKMVSLINYLQAVAARQCPYDAMVDENIMNAFAKALLDNNPKELYKVEKLRYMFYYKLLNLPMPEAARYWLVKKFLQFPHLQ